ncbi:MAG TPA: hypothetical protein VGO09_06710 [Flavisolibacter sp.]|nr:hypothetical protein [Flavisolibacter sp.]
MKRLLLTFTLALSLFSFSSFANEGKVSPAALQSFKSSFKNANEVKWTSTDTYFKAEFTFNNQYVSAFYDVDGKLIALTRYISSLQLPLGLQAELKNNYQDFWISDLFEVANEEGTSYYITLENAKVKITLKSISNLEWSGYKKQIKS